MFKLVLVACLAVSVAADTCKLNDLCPHKDHTMCLYTGVNVTACGGPPKSNGLVDNTKQLIVKLHNDLRRKVAKGLETQGKDGKQPSASNMKEMSWDDELAAVAQRWADQCFDEPGERPLDKCRNDARFPNNLVGQIYNGSFAEPTEVPKATNWTGVIRTWYSKVAFMMRSYVDKFVAKDNVGFYAQLVWADTNKVGCGYIAFTNKEGKYRKQYYCNYGPTGNLVGHPIYKVGPPCASCPDQCDDGLCKT